MSNINGEIIRDRSQEVIEMDQLYAIVKCGRGFEVLKCAAVVISIEMSATPDQH